MSVTTLQESCSLEDLPVRDCATSLAVVHLDSSYKPDVKVGKLQHDDNALEPAVGASDLLHLSDHQLPERFDSNQLTSTTSSFNRSDFDDSLDNTLEKLKDIGGSSSYAPVSRSALQHAPLPTLNMPHNTPSGNQAAVLSRNYSGCDQCHHDREKCEGGVPCPRCARTRKNCTYASQREILNNLMAQYQPFTHGFSDFGWGPELWRSEEENL